MHIRNFYIIFVILILVTSVIFVPLFSFHSEYKCFAIADIIKLAGSC